MREVIGEDDVDKLCERKSGDFDIGPSVKEGPAKTLVCRKCGSRKFLVGQLSYFTAIKCEKCGYEICIHEG